MPIRTAVCISGLARTYQKTHKAFIRNVLHPLREQGIVDVFISTWSTTEIEALSSAWWGDRVEPAVDINELRDIYRPRAIEVESFEGVRDSFLLKHYTSTVCPVPKIVKDGILVSMPAQYKVLRANNLKRMAESLTGTYDLVVRARFDIEIDRLRPVDLDLSKINVLWDRADGLMGDCLYMGSSSHMNTICDVFNNYRYLLNLPGTDMGPERNLRNHVTQMKIPIEVMQDYDFTLVRDGHRDEYHWNVNGAGYNPNNRDRRILD